MKKTTDLSGTSKGYKVFSVAILVVMVIFFLFPLYWIVTGSFKNKLEITALSLIHISADRKKKQRISQLSFTFWTDGY